jgi:hypothetical protein
MARAGRKRKIGERFPAGQIKPEESGASPSQIRRLRDAALAGMADPQWGSMAGIFYLSRKIDEIEYETAKRFGDLHTQYISVIGGPKSPKSSNPERGSLGISLDVDSELGEEETKKHINIMGRYNDAHTVLLGIGPAAEGDIIRFCSIPGESPAGHEAMLRVRWGLRALSVLWKVGSK